MNRISQNLDQTKAVIEQMGFRLTILEYPYDQLEDKKIQNLKKIDHEKKICFNLYACVAWCVCAPPNWRAPTNR